VPDDIITRILDAAIRAPSAGNAQHWAFIVVRDAELRRTLGDLYRKAGLRHRERDLSGARASPAHERGAIPAFPFVRRVSLGPHG
jgi:nitroreductase